MRLTPDRPSGLLLLVAGFTLWAAAFVALYAVLSIACELGWSRPDVGSVGFTRALLIAIWAGHVALAIGLLAWCWRRFTAAGHAPSRTARFIEVSTIGTSGAALVAILWTGIPLLATSVCL